jgi:hypothetical protein
MAATGSAVGTALGTLIGGPKIGGSIGGAIGGLFGSSGSAERAAAHAARQAAEMQQRAERQQREDLAPYRTSGQAATNRLSQLMGLDNFDRFSIAERLAQDNPALFANEAIPESRKRTPGSLSHQLYGDGTEYLVNGEWQSAAEEFTKNYTPEQNAAIDAEIERLKADESYGDLAKDFTMDDYEEDPGFQFRLEEGNKAIERAQARRGNFYSGAALKEADRYNSGQASQEYASAYDRFNNDNNTLYNRLAGISNTGLGAVNTGVASSQTASNNYQNIIGQLGSFNAANATQNQNNRNQSIAGLLGGGGSSYGGYNTRGYDMRTGRINM